MGNRVWRHDITVAQIEMRMKPTMLAFTIFSLGEAADQPNIVVIPDDDPGFGDVKCLNESSKAPTPNVNRLAASGVTFTEALAPPAMCTQTRWSASLPGSKRSFQN